MATAVLGQCGQGTVTAAGCDAALAYGARRTSWIWAVEINRTICRGRQAVTPTAVDARRPTRGGRPVAQPHGVAPAPCLAEPDAVELHHRHRLFRCGGGGGHTEQSPTTAKFEGERRINKCTRGKTDWQAAECTASLTGREARCVQ